MLWNSLALAGRELKGLVGCSHVVHFIIPCLRAATVPTTAITAYCSHCPQKVALMAVWCTYYIFCSMILAIIYLDRNLQGVQKSHMSCRGKIIITITFVTGVRFHALYELH